jgi:hypothetical protein
VNPNKLTNKRIQEKKTRIKGVIKKLYHRYHDPNSMPNEAKYNIDQHLQQSSTSSTSIDGNNHRNSSRAKGKLLSASSSNASPSQTSAGSISKKRRTISLSSDDDIVELVPENNCQRLLTFNKTNNS